MLVLVLFLPHEHRTVLQRLNVHIQLSRSTGV
jgi:hypothetical protein